MDLNFRTLSGNLSCAARVWRKARKKRLPQKADSNKKCNDWIELARSVVLQKCGNKADLISCFEEALIKEFLSVGYLRCGMDGEYNERWCITVFGASQLSAYVVFHDNTQKLKKRYRL